MKPFVYIASLVLAALLGFGLCSTFVVITDEETKATWDRERDSLKTANAMLTIRFDSARAESIAHQQRAESLATVPRTIYIANAQSLTRNASVDSLWLMLLTDPFIAVPETLVHHGQP